MVRKGQWSSKKALTELEWNLIHFIDCLEYLLFIAKLNDIISKIIAN